MNQTARDFPPFSGAVICYNEESHIERCLMSLEWCDQVVVVDSGSQDRTVELARQFPNVEIHVRPFDTFINQKNHALGHCSNEWVISLDADEVLTEENIAEIKSLPLDCPGYRIGRRSFIGDQEIRHGTWSPDYQLRIFHKSCSVWGGTNPHESIQIEGEVGHLKSRMLHYSYDSLAEFVERNTKYIHMMVDHLEASGRKTNATEPYVHCIGNFVKAFFVRRGFLDGAAGFFLARHIAGGSYLKYRLLAERNRENKAA